MDTEDVVHILNKILLSHKKKEIMPFAATWMQLEIIILNEVRRRRTNTIWYHLYVESKLWHKWTYLQKGNRCTDTENRLLVPRGKEGGSKIDWGFGVSRCKLLHSEWIDNKILLHSTWIYNQSPGLDHDRKGYKKITCVHIHIYIYTHIYIYVCVWLSHVAIQQKLTWHCKSTIIKKSKKIKTKSEPPKCLKLWEFLAK